MPIYLEGMIVAVEVNNIKGRDATQDFTFYKNFLCIKDKRGEEKVLEINSKEDFRSLRNKDGVAQVTAYKVKAQVEREGVTRDASLFRLSLSGFTPNK